MSSGPPHRSVVALLALCLVGATLSACGTSRGGAADQAARGDAQIDAAVSAGLVRLKVVVEGSIPHSTESRVEGLEVYDGRIYEGTGSPGRSEIRELSLETGRLLRSSPLPDGLDGGGVTVIGSLVWQLTRRGGAALQWNRATLQAGGRVPWVGDGRGLCHGENVLVASDGSATLRVLDRNGVDTQRIVEVRLLGEPLSGLGDLECGPQNVQANVLGTRWIVVINLVTGEVTAAADISAGLPPGVDLRRQVANGIAQIPGTDQYLLTGSEWPRMSRVRFVPADAPDGRSAAR